jgi:hypothetical protein
VNFILQNVAAVGTDGVVAVTQQGATDACSGTIGVAAAGNPWDSALHYLSDGEYGATACSRSLNGSSGWGLEEGRLRLQGRPPLRPRQISLLGCRNGLLPWVAGHKAGLLEAAAPGRRITSVDPACFQCRRQCTAQPGPAT